MTEETRRYPLYAVLLYLLVAQIYAAYYCYEFAQDHGFLSSLFIGPIVGEIKGLLFPFFI
jgi:hypothetical protein